MKYKTTNKEIKNGYSNIICLSYCTLQDLLKYYVPIAYNYNSYGWKYDVYHINNNVCIVTGYQPFGNIKPDYKIIKNFEEKSKNINDYTIPFEKRKENADIILNEFIQTVINK